jgi:hypothetical protein
LLPARVEGEEPLLVVGVVPDGSVGVVALEVVLAFDCLLSFELWSTR